MKLKETKGITLIALVVTIIVLLILAGISIQMLTGENSILINATNAKKSTGIAEVEEAARLVYTGLFASKYISGTEPTLDEVVAELRSQGYTITSDGATGSSITGIELVGGPNLAVATGETLEVEYTPISSSGEGYFAVVDGLKYEMTLDKTKGQINVSRTAAGSTGGDNEGNTTITVSTSDGNKATALIDEGNKKIRIKGEAEGTEIKLYAKVGTNSQAEVGEITIKTLSTTAPSNIYVGGTQVTSTLSLDGAMLLSASSSTTTTPSTTTNEQFLWTSSNPEVVEVTTDGIIKCGSKTSNEADAEKAGSGTVTITCKGSGTSQATCTVTTKDAKKVSTLPAGSPTLPEGFTAINTNDAKWTGVNGAPEVNKGLVMMDERGNQFVWVPVPDVIWDGKTTITTGKDLATESNPYTPMAQTNATTDYEGVLYTFSGTTATYQSTYKLGINDYREPDVLLSEEDSDSSSGYGDFSLYAGRGYNLLKKYITEYKEKDLDKEEDRNSIKTSWKSRINTEYTAMVTKVNASKGFWVGRYETSYDDKLDKVASIAGARSRTADAAESTGMSTWYGLYQKQKDFSIGKSYTSGMIWGSQWDAMLNWMAKNKLAIGTYDSSKRNGDDRYITGSIRDASYANDKWNNVFDLEGCAYEWTAEACSTFSRAFRRRPLQQYLCSSSTLQLLSVQCVLQHFLSPHTLHVGLNA